MNLWANLTLTPLAMGSLALALMLVAALPSLSVLAVTTRSLSGGIKQGAWTTLGIVVGDFFYLLVAWIGLSGIRLLPDIDLRGLTWLAAAWLAWLAWQMWRNSVSAPPLVAPHTARGGDNFPLTASAGANSGLRTTSSGSFFTGLSLTLADQKAIAFYLGFLPAFLDLQGWTMTDAVAVFVITGFSVGGVKLLYAAMATRVAGWLAPTTHKLLHRAAGAALGIAAVWLIVRAVLGPG